MEKLMDNYVESITRKKILRVVKGLSDIFFATFPHSYPQLIPQSYPQLPRKVNRLACLFNKNNGFVGINMDEQN